MREIREHASVLSALDDLDPQEAQRLLSHPLPYWVEQMTVNYIRANGGQAEKRNGAWELVWPDGERLAGIMFAKNEAQTRPNVERLTLENPKVRALATHLTPFAPGQPIPVVSVPGLPREIRGYWSLWRISLTTVDWNRHRILPLFLNDDGRTLVPTARYIWDQLLNSPPELRTLMDSQSSKIVYERLRDAVERQGEAMYMELLQEHRKYLEREREKAQYAFDARRRATLRVSLPQVRDHRLRLLHEEERRSWQELQDRARVLPDMTSILLLRVEGKSDE